MGINNSTESRPTPPVWSPVAADEPEDPCPYDLAIPNVHNEHSTPAAACSLQQVWFEVCVHARLLNWQETVFHQFVRDGASHQIELPMILAGAGKIDVQLAVPFDRALAAAATAGGGETGAPAGAGASTGTVRVIYHTALAPAALQTDPLADSRRPPGLWLHLRVVKNKRPAPAQCQAILATPSAAELPAEAK